MSPVIFVLTSLAITSATLSVIFFVAWRTLERMPHALTWSITFALSTLQWIVNLNSARVPSPDVYWVTVSAITLGVVTLGLLGHFQRVGRNVGLPALLLPPLACFAAICWFTLGAAHTGLRMSLQPAYAAATMLLSAWLIVGFRNKTLPAEWGAAIALTLFAIAQIVAAGAAFLQGPQTEPSYLAVYQAVNFALLPGAFAGVGMFVIFMLASDLSEDMKATAVRDQLTGILNRRGFCEASAGAYATSRRRGYAVSVIMSDIDHFKKINDRYGHMFGDDALCHFADVLAKRTRQDDIVARMGGEEFALVLPGCSLDMAVAVAREICRRLRETPLQTEFGQVTMTASFGVAALTDADSCLTDAIVRADGALYQAKHLGRDRVEVELTRRSGDTIRIGA